MYSTPTLLVIHAGENAGGLEKVGAPHSPMSSGPIAEIIRAVCDQALQYEHLSRSSSEMLHNNHKLIFLLHFLYF